MSKSRITTRNDTDLQIPECCMKFLHAFAAKMGFLAGFPLRMFPRLNGRSRGALATCGLRDLPSPRRSVSVPRLLRTSLRSVNKIKAIKAIKGLVPRCWRNIALAGAKPVCLDDCLRSRRSTFGCSEHRCKVIPPRYEITNFKIISRLCHCICMLNTSLSWRYYYSICGDLPIKYLHI